MVQREIRISDERGALVRYPYLSLHHLPLMLLFLLSFALISPLAAHADGGAPQLAYVAGAARGIGIIDIAQRKVTSTLKLGGNPGAVLLSLDGRSLYVTQPDEGKVSIFAAKTGKTLCTASLPGRPSLLTLSLDGSLLYVAGQGDSVVRTLDVTNCAVMRSFETHQPVFGLAIAASTAADATPATPRQLWISGSSMLTVYEVTGHLLGTVPVAGGPQNICIPGGYTAYVTTRQGSLVAVDLATRQVFRTLLQGSQFGTMDYDATTGDIYVPDPLHNQLQVLTPVSAAASDTPHEPKRTLALSGPPQSIAITNDGQLGFAALANGHVQMLDIPSRKAIVDIAVGGTPSFIITGLYPPPDPPVQLVPTQQQQNGSAQLPTSTILLIALVVLVDAVLLSGIWLFWRRYRKR